MQNNDCIEFLKTIISIIWIGEYIMFVAMIIFSF